MGRKIIKSQASALVSEITTNLNSLLQSDGCNSEEYEGHGIELLKSEAALEYLCNLKPHRLVSGSFM
jgi:L-arabinokinase